MLQTTLRSASIAMALFAMANSAWAEETVPPDRIHGHAIFTGEQSITYFMDLYEQPVCVSPYWSEAIFPSYRLQSEAIPYETIAEGMQGLSDGSCVAIAVPYQDIGKIGPSVPDGWHAIAKGAGRNSPTVRKVEADIRRKCENLDVFDCDCVAGQFLDYVEEHHPEINGDGYVGLVNQVNRVFEEPMPAQCVNREVAIAEGVPECVTESKIFDKMTVDNATTFCTCLADHAVDLFQEKISSPGGIYAAIKNGGVLGSFLDAKKDEALCR